MQAVKTRSPEQSGEQTRFLNAAPTSCRGIVAKAFEGAASPRAAIKAKCLDCCHFDRAEVAGCTVILCPLWAYRPYQQEEKE